MEMVASRSAVPLSNTTFYLNAGFECRYRLRWMWMWGICYPLDFTRKDRGGG